VLIHQQSQDAFISAFLHFFIFVFISRKWRLTFEDFIEFLQQLLYGKNMAFEELKIYMVEAGIPVTQEVFVK